MIAKREIIYNGQSNLATGDIGRLLPISFLSSHVMSYGHGLHLGFDRNGHSAIRSADHKNPTLERNMKWIGRPVAKKWPFEIRHIRRGHLGPHFLGGHRVIDPTIRKSGVGFLWALHCDRCAIFEFDHSTAVSIECLRRSNQYGVGQFGSKFWGVPLGVGP